jgi:hypothetical protein
MRSIPTANLRHILSALRLLRKRLSGPPKRHIQPERYAKFALEYFLIFEKYIY